MTYDNRHFPLLDKPIFRHDNVQFFLRAQPFVFFADSSSGTGDDDDSIGLFEIDGKLNQNDWDDVLLKTGSIKRKLVPPNFSDSNLDIPWHLRGRFDAGGLAFRWYYAFSPNFEIGGSWFIMGLRSREEALLHSNKALADRTDPNDRMKIRQLTKGDVRDLQSAFNEQRKASHLDGFLWSRAGISDLDLYFRTAYRCHYFLRTKTIDAALKLGIIAPAAARRDINNPASIPFGGNGMWGGYVDMALDTELKDDMFAGMNFRFIQRMGKSERMRLPPLSGSPDDAEQSRAFQVPLTFEPLFGQAHVSPGFTFVYSPYFAITNYRDGFGAQLSYTLIMHTRDRFKDVKTDKNIPVDLDILRRRSSWASEYVTFGVNYDFAKDRERRGALPMLYLDVDYPVHFFAAQRSNKTFGISLRIESDLW